MARKLSYSIETLSHSSTSIVWLGATKVAILFAPLHEGDAYQLYPHPGTYRDLNFSGLPAPLNPGFRAFSSIDDVHAFLGIKPRVKHPTDFAVAA